MPLKYQRRLLDHLRHGSYQPSDVGRLVEDLAIEDAPDFEAAVKQLAIEGVVEVSEKGIVRLPSIAQRKGAIVGVFKRNPRGFGFVKPESGVREGDIFIPPDETMDAMTGDTVQIEIRRDKRRERPGDPPQYSGVVIDIIARGASTITGEVDRRGRQWIAYPDGREHTQPIVLRDAESKNVKPGDKVAIELIEYPGGGAAGSLAEGVITKVLGAAGEPDAETQAIIAAFALPGEFPRECVDQARAITKQFDEDVARFEKEGAKAIPDRMDLTGDLILTIDPPDAKDYDDAISIKRVNGNWELAVHIADVGEFIEPGTPLDREAYDRGNSVYLPRLVIPMLPEILSNGICSLQERVTRFSKSALMRYDKDGNILAEGVASTVIRSAKRLTYLEAQALIDGDVEEAKKHAKTEPNYTPEIINALKEMNACARAIRARRERQGMISLELPDADLIFDEDGRVIDVVPEDDAFTHTIIEMFMVEANEVLARLFENLDVPLIRRVHPAPTPGDVDDMRKAAKVAGYAIPKNPTREELQSLLNATRGTPAARAVHMAVLRTLTKAEYSPGLIGHFALASGAYAHFTSPIRRYPDLTVHRALLAYLRKTDNGRLRPTTDKERKNLGRELRDDKLCPPQEDLVVVGKHCSARENNAEDAERQLRQFLVLQHLEGKVGEALPGVVTGVFPRGVYVQLDKYLADGLIKVEDLPGDVTRSNKVPKWRIDKHTGALADEHSGRSFSMGDRVMVSIAAIDLAKRQMDLVIADPASRAAGKAKTPKLKLDQAEGGLASAGGAGFQQRTGKQKRSQRSRSREKRKTDYRRKK